ncbi:MAG: AMP-binding protein [Verrucomicrobia bacterium]|nr:AMP-binding protein [Verrucomicrobiota bacterium]
MASPELQPGNRILGPAARATVGELVVAFAEKNSALAAPAPLALIGESPVELIAAAGWLAQTQTDGLILPAERLTPELEMRLMERGYALVNLDRRTVVKSAQPVAPKPGRVSLLTSGTTGEPKIVEHTWASLFTMARVKSGRAANWLLTYQPGTYAWWQMVTMALFLPEQALTVTGERTPVALTQAAIANGVTAISATPTFWRMVLLQFSPEELRRVPLRQLTLGGEAVDQAILDRLRAQFPDATLTHIYASSEAGAAIIVRDGREGFPAAWLASENSDAAAAGDSPQLQIRDGLLWIRSPYATQSGWLCSGDLCEMRDGRVIILGREQSSFINVGGAKVPAHEVERVLRSHPAVLWCRVGRRKAPFLGELVAADVVFKSAADRVPDGDLARFCGERLAEHMVPRFWNVLAAIPATNNLKTKLN